MSRKWDRKYQVDQLLAHGEDTADTPHVYSLGELDPDQVRRIDETSAKAVDEKYTGWSFGFNPRDPELTDDGTRRQEPDMDAAREKWLAGNVPDQDRGKNAVIGAIGLYSVIQEMGPYDEGLGDALHAFFDDAKRIAQQSAHEAIYGPSNTDGPSLNQQSIDAIKALAGTVQYAGLSNAAVPEDKRENGAIYVLGQAISTSERSGDGLDFMNEIARVVQDRDWTRDIENDMERMGQEDRVRALMYREPDSVPEDYNVDATTRDAVQSFAESIV